MTKGTHKTHVGLLLRGCTVIPNYLTQYNATRKRWTFPIIFYE